MGLRWDFGVWSPSAPPPYCKYAVHTYGTYLVRKPFGLHAPSGSPVPKTDRFSPGRETVYMMMMIQVRWSDMVEQEE